MNINIVRASGRVPLLGAMEGYWVEALEIEHNSEIESHIAIGVGSPIDGCLVRINSACITSEVFYDERCDCRWQLDRSLEMIGEAGMGLITYHPSEEGRGVGILDKLRSYTLMSAGISTKEAFEKLGLAPDARTFAAGASILAFYGINSLRLISNNPHKVSALERSGISVVECVPIISDESRYADYLKSKSSDFGHLISF